jgi:hypothetical protein
LLSLLFRLCDAGKIPLIQADADSNKRIKPVIVSRPATENTPRSVWVPIRSLNRLLGRLGAPAVDPEPITQSFPTVLAFLGVQEYRGELGWAFREDWWTEQYRGRDQETCLVR